LEAFLANFFRKLKLRLFLEGNQATEQASFTSNFLIWVCLRISCSHGTLLTSFHSQVLYPITLTVSIFSMQPAVIPFNLTKEWLCFSVFILIAVMSIIYRAMKKWEALRKKLTSWMKVRQPEGEGFWAVIKDYLKDIIMSQPDSHNSGVLNDVESLRARAVLGSRRGVVR
jgi:hypothetical protein